MKDKQTMKPLLRTTGLVMVLLLVFNFIKFPKLVVRNEKDSALELKLREVELAQQETRLLLNKLYCSIGKALPSGGFCIDKNNIYLGGNNMWSGKLCADLEVLFGKVSVGDFGAGLGHYGRCFLRQSENMVSSGNQHEVQDMNTTYHTRMKHAGLLGKPQVVRSWHGWDGAANIDDVSHGRILSLDLSKPVDVGRRFDWVMSLEVGEHIPAAGEQPFIDNLVKHACVGVVVSWAVPGQGGHQHVNCRSNDYVKKQMGLRGLKAQTEAEKKLRAAADLPWFKNTLMVFKFDKKRC